MTNHRMVVHQLFFLVATGSLAHPAKEGGEEGSERPAFLGGQEQAGQ
jgi:hypothetical protein